MTIYATGNPVGSTNPKDLIDNSQNFDYLSIGPLLSYPDRRGVNRLSWAGIEASFAAAQADKEERFQQFLLSSGYQFIGDYAPGLLVAERNQIFRKDGEFYRAGAALALPYTTTGVWADESAKFVSVGDAALRQEMASPTGSTLMKHLESFAGTVLRKISDMMSESGLSVETFGGVAGGVADSTAGFATMEAAVTGREVNLNGRTYLVSTVPVGNTYVNGFFKVGATTYNANLDAGSIASQTDTGGIEPAYTGGTDDTPTVPGRSTTWNRVMAAVSNCRVMFVRGFVAGSIYTWCKSNVGFAGASRQCVVDGPQSSTISSEECQSYGFRASHYGSAFGYAEVSSGGSMFSRLPRVAGSYVLLAATNTSRIGTGSKARIRPVVVGGQVIDYVVERPGSRYVVTDTDTLVVDRSSFGSGATFTITVDGSGGITAAIPVLLGSGYTTPDSVEVRLLQREVQCAQVATQTSVISGPTAANCMIAASVGSTITNTQQGFIGSSDASTVTGARGTVLGSSGSNATASGAMVLGATLCDSISDRSVIIGRRGIADNAGSLVIAENPGGNRATSNKVLEATSAGNLRLKGIVSPGTIFTDYAEMFENCVIGAIPTGTIVARVRNKVRPARKGDKILGVVSATAAFVAGDTQLCWAYRYVYDKLDRPVMRDVEMVKWQGFQPYEGTVEHAHELHLTIPAHANFFTRDMAIENATGEEAIAPVDCVSWEGTEGYDGSVETCELEIPDYAVHAVEQHQKENDQYDPTQVNVPRSARPDEWTCVGLMGQLRVLVGADVAQAMDSAGDDDVIYVAADGSLSDVPTRLECMVIRTPYNAADGYAIALCLSVGGN